MITIKQELKKTKIYDFARKVYHRIQKTKKERFIQKELLYMDALIDKVVKYDIVSFDIFDTLLARGLYEPDDLFNLMEEKLSINQFKQKRKEAEQKARERYHKDVNIVEIYNEFQTIHSISDDIRREMQALEESLELEFITPREEMLKFVNTLAKRNQSMIIVSDMYLKKETILKMLKKCGYNLDLFQHIYISNDINQRKDTKEIWTTIKRDYPIQTIIHIGDNDTSDVLFPKEFCIDTVKIRSSKELFQHSSLYLPLQQYIEKRTVSDSLFLGNIINHKLFNSPFSNLQIDTLYDFGYCFHGPILYEFLKFIQKESQQSDCLLFLAREGYSLQKLYQKFCQLKKIEEKENIYFLASRKATYTATTYSEDDIYHMIDKEFNGTFSAFMNQIFDVEVEDNTIIQLPKDVDIVRKKIKPYIPQILNNAKKEKEAYLKYINQTIKNVDQKQLAVIDLGYSGTIQYNLTKLLNKEITGIYLTNSENIKRYRKNSKLKYCFLTNENDNYKFIYYYSLILEFFLSAPFGQLQKFELHEGKAIPIYNEETMDDMKKGSIDELYNGVLQYIHDMSSIENIYDISVNPFLVVDLYKNIVDCHIVNRLVKDRFDFMDSFEASEIRNVFKIISKY